MLDILEEEDTLCKKFWDELPSGIEVLLGIMGFIMPWAMILVGAFYYDMLCWHVDSPYPLWLIVGGSVFLATIFFLMFFVCRVRRTVSAVAFFGH